VVKKGKGGINKRGAKQRDHPGYPRGEKASQGWGRGGMPGKKPTISARLSRLGENFPFLLDMDNSKGGEASPEIWEKENTSSHEKNINLERGKGDRSFLSTTEKKGNPVS